MELIIANIFRVSIIIYMIFYSFYHQTGQSFTFLVGSSLDILEIILTGGHFYASIVSTHTFYINHASSIAVLLGDIFNFNNTIYFSIGDILIFIAFIFTL